MAVEAFLKTIVKRRSIRRFKATPVAEGDTENLIQALLWAPSAGNLQCRKFFFIYNPTIKKQLVEAAWGQDFIAQAPLAIVACADMGIGSHYGKRGTDLYVLMDVAASIQNLLLVAHELGLGTCWVGAFKESEVVRIMKLQKHLRPVAIVPVGCPAEQPAAPERVRQEEAIEFWR